jgi:hypothetical protein
MGNKYKCEELKKKKSRNGENPIVMCDNIYFLISMLQSMLHSPDNLFMEIILLC